MKRYTPGCAGFVVEHRYEFRGREHRTYWYGPDRLATLTFGAMVWGPLDYSAAVFPSRPAARKAVEADNYWRDGFRARRVVDVEREIAERTG